MNKGELIKAVVAVKPYRTRSSEVEDIVNTTLETIKDTLSNGEDVKITGFGSFEVVDRKARTGRNPRTGEAIQIPEHQVVSFRPGKGLKASVK